MNLFTCYLGTLLAAVFLATAGSQEPVTKPVGGRVEVFELRSKVFNNVRMVRVLLPPGYVDRPQIRYPVLYFNDGYEVFSDWDLPSIVTPLIQTRAIVPLIVVGIDHAGENNRGDGDLARANEYLPYPTPIEPAAPNPRGMLYPKFLIDEVMAAIQQKYRTQAGRANVGLGGASYGAYAALYTAITRPDVVGKLLLESGGAPPGSPILDDLRRAKALPALISFAIGTDEFPNADVNRRFVASQQAVANLMQQVSPQSRVRFIVDEGGRHESAVWKARLPGAMTFLFGEQPRESAPSSR
jgi:enterochelin esterase-like enzyme